MSPGCRPVTYGILAGEDLSAEPAHAQVQEDHSDHFEEVRGAEAAAHPMDVASEGDLLPGAADLG